MFNNFYNVYDLDAWPRYPKNSFKFRNSLFEATDIVKNSYKEKYVYSGYVISGLVEFWKKLEKKFSAIFNLL